MNTFLHTEWFICVRAQDVETSAAIDFEQDMHTVADRDINNTALLTSLFMTFLTIFEAIPDKLSGLANVYSSLGKRFSRKLLNKRLIPRNSWLITDCQFKIQAKAKSMLKAKVKSQKSKVKNLGRGWCID